MSLARGNSGDWFYGASASLPRAVQWQQWYANKERAGKLNQPIERFLVDASMKAHQTYIKLAQAVRKNPGWARNFTGDEMAHILEVVGEAHAWFQKNRPTDEALSRLEPELVFIAQALGGLFKVGVALGQELDQANRKGFVLVDTGSEARELAS